MFIDTHCHLVDSSYDDINKVLDDARKDGVIKFILGGSNFEDNYENINLASNNNDVYVSAGFHPDCALEYTDEDISKLDNLINQNLNKIVAIGEIGLDYHYDDNDKDKQKELFIKQLNLAKKYNLPVVIHTRDAIFETYEILREQKINKGVIHCFSGSYEMALKFINMGFYLGIGGVVTFKNSKLGECLKKLGFNNIVLETDSPYLSPIRGEKNEPKNVVLIAKYLSNLYDVDIQKMSNILLENTNKVFDFRGEYVKEKKEI